MFFDIISALGLLGTAKSLGDQARAQRDVTRLEQKSQRVQVRNARRAAIRETQIARAQATASAVGAGSYGSSGSAGGVSGINSRLATELGQSSRLSGISRETTQAYQDLNTARNRTELFSNLYNFGVSQGGDPTFGVFNG